MMLDGLDAQELDVTFRWSKIGPALVCALLAIPVGAVSVSFDRFYVDTQYGGNTRPGWVRAGDMDLDGDLDIVAGGGLALYIYENNGAARGWTRWGSLDSTGQIGANGGVLFDVDNDTDLDIVCAKYKSDLGWWENPGGQLSHYDVDLSQAEHGELLPPRHDPGGHRPGRRGRGGRRQSQSGLLDRHDIKVKWFRPGAQPTQTWGAHTIEPGSGGGRHLMVMRVSTWVTSIAMGMSISPMPTAGTRRPTTPPPAAGPGTR